MEVEIISRETIKPSSPTPKSLKNFKLSLIDQFISPVYTTLLFFYSSNGHVSVSERSQQLKKSLSDTLSLYYPLAGRVSKDNIVIDCSDYGALYVEARVHCCMSPFLEKPNRDDLEKLIAVDIGSTAAVTGGFFSLFQVNFFDCGGVVFGVSICHKLCDATTVGMFMRCWAAKTSSTLGSAAPVVQLYNAAALFPPGNNPPPVDNQLLEFEKDKVHKQRIVFDASKIAALRVAAASPTVERPSRVEAVTALIWKCALNAARSNSGGSSKPSVLIQPVNIRPRMSPPLPENSVGNLLGHFAAQKDESEAELQGLVGELREKLQVFDKKYVKMLQQEDAFEALTDYMEKAASLKMRQGMEFYIFTSVCNTSLYDTDFGWGRPVWVTIPNASTNTVALIDTNKGDGSMEGWVVLSKQDMHLFENDPELLAYASLNPSILDTIHA